VFKLNKTKRTLLFVVNSAKFFLSHRLRIALAAKDNGFNVHIATADGTCVEKIKSLGLKHHVIPFDRKGQNPFIEITTLISLFKLFRTLRPDLVHLVTIKPIIYGGIAAKIAGVKAIVAAISGMGTVFISNSIFAGIRRYLILMLYKNALKHKNSVVIFQNQSDEDLFINHRIIQREQALIIKGAGVDLTEYAQSLEPPYPIVVIMVSRLLRDKGVFEYVNAAKILKNRNINLEMRLVGDLDRGNQSSLTAMELDTLKKEKNVVVLGSRNDIADQYAQSHIVCLPSYREGLPKSLIEAAACGRAIVTTDTPGCRDAIIPNATGLVVPIKNSKLLAEAIQELATNKRLRVKMGMAARNLAVREFSITKIIEQHLEVYKKL